MRKVKYKATNIVTIVLFGALLLLNMNLFGFISKDSLSGIANSVNRTGEVIIVGVIVLFCLLRFSLVKFDYWTNFYIFVLISLIICGVYSILKYNQTIFDIYIMVNCFLMFCLVPVFVQNEEMFNIVIKLVMIFAIANVIVTCLQSVMYNSFGIIFVQGISKASLRNGLLRYGNATSYSPLVVIFILGNYKKAVDFLPKFFKVIFFLMALYAIIFANQTRGITIAVMAAIFVMLLFKNRDNKNRIIALICIAIAVIVISRLPQFRYIFNSIFSNSSEYAAETHNIDIRFENIKYRLSFFKENAFFAMGIVRPISSALLLIARGPGGLYYAEDIGIFDTICSFGIFGIIMMLLIFVRWFKSIYITVKNKTLGDNVWILGLVAYLLVSSFSIGFFMPERFICFTIIVAAIEIQTHKFKRPTLEK